MSRPRRRSAAATRIGDRRRRRGSRAAWSRPRRRSALGHASVRVAAPRLLAILRGARRGAGEAAGEAWYRVRARARRARPRNLSASPRCLVERASASPRVAAAATDPAALERLLRRAFRHAARYYLEWRGCPHGPGRARASASRRDARTRRAAFGTRAPMILASCTSGPSSCPALFASPGPARRITAPMETLATRRCRPSSGGPARRSGIEIVRPPRRPARRSPRPPGAGGTVGLVADRDVAGGASSRRSSAPRRRCPPGPALLAVETRPADLPRRGPADRRGRYAGRLAGSTGPAEGDRRARMTATMAALAAGDGGGRSPSRPSSGGRSSSRSGRTSIPRPTPAPGTSSRRPPR